MVLPFNTQIDTKNVCLSCPCPRAWIGVAHTHFTPCCCLSAVLLTGSLTRPRCVYTEAKRLAAAARCAPCSTTLQQSGLLLEMLMPHKGLFGCADTTLLMHTSSAWRQCDKHFVSVCLRHNITRPVATLQSSLFMHTRACWSTLKTVM